MSMKIIRCRIQISVRAQASATATTVSLATLQRRDPRPSQGVTTTNQWTIMTFSWKKQLPFQTPRPSTLAIRTAEWRRLRPSIRNLFLTRGFRAFRKRSSQQGAMLNKLTKCSQLAEELPRDPRPSTMGIVREVHWAIERTRTRASTRKPTLLPDKDGSSLRGKPPGATVKMMIVITQTLCNRILTSRSSRLTMKRRTILIRWSRSTRKTTFRQRHNSMDLMRSNWKLTLGPK